MSRGGSNVYSTLRSSGATSGRGWRPVETSGAGRGSVEGSEETCNRSSCSARKVPINPAVRSVCDPPRPPKRLSELESEAVEVGVLELGAVEPVAFKPLSAGKDAGGNDCGL